MDNVTGFQGVFNDALGWLWRLMLLVVFPLRLIWFISRLLWFEIRITNCNMLHQEYHEHKGGLPDSCWRSSHCLRCGLTWANYHDGIGGLYECNSVFHFGGPKWSGEDIVGFEPHPYVDIEAYISSKHTRQIG